jgi:hypothetical protein
VSCHLPAAQARAIYLFAIRPGFTFDALDGLPSGRRDRLRASLGVLTSEVAVNESGLGSFADGKGEEGIDRSFEWTGTPMHLGEEKPSLERGEQGRGEVVWVDAGRELPLGM